MKQEIFITEDGSHSIRVPEWNVTFHSIHGAIAESQHIFIRCGFELINQNNISVFELGFGTGLNALLTFIAGTDKNIYYEAIEQFPLSINNATQLNYTDQLKRADLHRLFVSMHSAPGNNTIQIADNFILHKRLGNIIDSDVQGSFDVIYFDAFDPVTQPELWSVAVFKKMFSLLKPGGMLLTYCSKTSVRKAMQEAGFSVEKIEGPKGKREIVRALA